MLSTLTGFFARHPLVANSVLYGTLLVGAEFSQQTISKKVMVENPSQRQPYDIRSMARYAVVGYGITPQIAYRWYVWLDCKYVGTTARIVLKKVLLDQFILSPPILVIFFVSFGLMEGKSNILEECQNKFLTTFQASCLFWLPVQSLNFWLIPPHARLAFVGSAAFIWANVLCWIKKQKNLHH